jgi:hypothetical protein
LRELASRDLNEPALLDQLRALHNAMRATLGANLTGRLPAQRLMRLERSLRSQLADGHLLRDQLADVPSREAALAEVEAICATLRAGIDEAGRLLAAQPRPRAEDDRALARMLGVSVLLGLAFFVAVAVWLIAG